jgi:hypothetical protein
MRLINTQRNRHARVRRTDVGWCGVAFALALTSCTGDRTVEQTAQHTTLAGAAATYDFVLTDLVIDQSDDPTRAGFNLDDQFSGAADPAGCQSADAVSDLDLDQNQNSCSPDTACTGGVDNALPGLVDAFDAITSTSGRQVLANRLANGRMIWLMRLVGVDSLSDDDHVEVVLYRGFAADNSCSNLFNGLGKFYVDNSSLEKAGNLEGGRWVFEGSIVGGRLGVRRNVDPGAQAVAPVQFRVDLDAVTAISVPIYQMRLRVDLVDSKSGARGNLGGWVLGSEFGESIKSVFPTLDSGIQSLLPNLTDIAVNGTCDTGAAPVVGGLGIGLRFSLARATILGTADKPSAGMCGSW